MLSLTLQIGCLTVLPHCDSASIELCFRNKGLWDLFHPDDAKLEKSPVFSKPARPSPHYQSLRSQCYNWDEVASLGSFSSAAICSLDRRLASRLAGRLVWLFISMCSFNGQLLKSLVTDPKFNICECEVITVSRAGVEMCWCVHGLGHGTAFAYFP